MPNRQKAVSGKWAKPFPFVAVSRPVAEWLLPFAVGFRRPVAFVVAARGSQVLQFALGCVGPLKGPEKTRYLLLAPKRRDIKPRVERSGTWGPGYPERAPKGRHRFFLSFATCAALSGLVWCSADCAPEVSNFCCRQIRGISPRIRTRSVARSNEKQSCHNSGEPAHEGLAQSLAGRPRH
jgi:hypothetical protein